jgi:membrane protein implicated in regulation of membrane protease activity
MSDSRRVVVGARSGNLGERWYDDDSELSHPHLSQGAVIMHSYIFFWGWLILALVFFVGELLTAGFFLVAFGIGAALAAVAAFAGLDILWQLGIFVVVSAIAVFSLRRFADSVSPTRQRAQVGIDRVLGKKAVVIESINALNGTGIVRVDAEEWRALPEDRTQIIPEKSTVEVLEVDGTRLIVRPLSPPVDSENN